MTVIDIKTSSRSLYDQHHLTRNEAHWSIMLQEGYSSVMTIIFLRGNLVTMPKQDQKTRAFQNVHGLSNIQKLSQKKTSHTISSTQLPTEPFCFRIF